MNYTAEISPDLMMLNNLTMLSWFYVFDVKFANGDKLETTRQRIFLN